MLVRGAWSLCDDGVVRPVIAGQVLAADGTWLTVEFLVDVGADRTVFISGVLAALALPEIAATHQLGGVGGPATTVVIGTQIRLPLDGGAIAIFRGSFAGFTDPAALDMSVLGRDIMNLFAVIVDRPGDVVCLVGQGHTYSIIPKP